jgi:hypothetical protein
MCEGISSETGSALELVLVALRLVMFVAVVVVTVVQLHAFLFFLPDKTQPMSPRASFRVVVLFEYNTTDNIGQPTSNT